MCLSNLLKYSEFKFKKSPFLLLAHHPCTEVRIDLPWVFQALLLLTGSFELPAGTAVNITLFFSADCNDKEQL